MMRKRQDWHQRDSLYSSILTRRAQIASAIQQQLRRRPAR